MSTRYSNVFSLSAPLYAAGAPVLIAAGALLKDNETGEIIAQLKLQNLTAAPIKAVTAVLIPFDTAGAQAGESIAAQYLDLNAVQGQEFGQKQPIAIPDKTARSFRATVSRVVLADGKTWTAAGEPWETLEPPEKLGAVLPNIGFAEQYRIQFGQQCRYAPRKVKDLWQCACGALNQDSGHTCYSCGLRLGELTAGLDVEALSAARDERLEMEREQEEKQQAEAKERSKKTKKRAIVAAIVLAVAIAAGVLIGNCVSYAKKSDAYQQAVALAEAGNYNEAVEVFASLGDFKDSERLYAEYRSILTVKEKMEVSLSSVTQGNIDAMPDSPVANEFRAVWDQYDPYCGVYYATDYRLIVGRIESDFTYSNGILKWCPTGADHKKLDAPFVVIHNGEPIQGFDTQQTDVTIDGNIITSTYRGFEWKVSLTGEEILLQCSLNGRIVPNDEGGSSYTWRKYTWEW